MDNLNLFTATPVARRIASAAGVEPEPVLRALRKMMANGMVQASIMPQGSSTAPNLFDEAGVYRAAVAFCLSRLGLSDESVREATKYFNRMEGEALSGDAVWQALNDLVNRPYFFHLFVAPDYFQKPANVISGSFSAKQNGGEVYMAEAWITTITIPLRGLVANLIESDDETAPLPSKVKGD